MLSSISRSCSWNNGVECHPRMDDFLFIKDDVYALTALLTRALPLAFTMSDLAVDRDADGSALCSWVDAASSRHVQHNIF
eukprot:4859295-Amphidinium_carterae.1